MSTAIVIALAPDVVLIRAAHVTHAKVALPVTGTGASQRRFHVERYMETT
jgi:hypothetical protein